MLKTLLTVVLFSVWLATLTFIWWGFDPEGFWQKLVCVMAEVVVGGVLGGVAVFIALFTYDEIDKMHARKQREKQEQERRQ